MNTENNRLIAEFMGAKETKVEGLQNPMYYPINGKSEYSHKLKYHSDWNWIMGVVDMVESLGYDFNILTPTVIEIWSGEGEHLIAVNGAGNKIDATYKAIIEFIKWYNENKK